MERSRVALAGALIVGTLPLVGSVTADAVGDCLRYVDGSRFASAEELREGNQVMADLGPRPTGSPAHEQFIQYLEQRVDAIDGLDRTAIEDTIERQLETAASLTIEATDVPVAGPVPYSRPVPDGVTAPLVLVPAGTAIDEAPEVTGSIVVRPAPPGSVPFVVFAAVAYAMIDPTGQLDLLGNYERDWLGAAAKIADLRAAEASGAAGVLFVSDLPRAQIEGQYAPYEGVRYDVPALYLGADEGLPLVDRLAAAAGGPPVHGTIRLDATREPAPTRTLVAALPGRSAERIVVQSHTDGMNAVWDNGPIAMLALAEHLAALPLACRPRTIQFVFTTAHLHLSHSGAERYAALLDEEYDSGTVAFVVAIEHLGAREFVAAPRGDGGPGRQLVPTGRPEMLASFVSESPVLALNLIDRVRQRHLPFTLVLRGADAPAVHFPPHRSFGGEGGPYREHLIPTVAAITGPWTLFNPAFGLDELVDPELMRRQAMVFGDVILANADVPRQVLAGLDPVYRLGRDLLGADPLGLPPIDPLGLASDLVAELSALPDAVAPAAAGSGTGTLSASWFCGLLGRSP